MVLSLWEIGRACRHSVDCIVPKAWPIGKLAAWGRVVRVDGVHLEMAASSGIVARIVVRGRTLTSERRWAGQAQSVQKERTMTKLLIATNNRGKVREYEDLLAGLPVEITFPAQEGLSLDVEESGQTFEENACLKAQAFARHSGLLTLADDSGLEVDALAGAPGVYSARYAGPGASDADRYRKLLAALDQVPEGQRSARFRCVIAVARPDGRVETVAGACEGQIGFEPRGDHGFGYDPVFLVTDQGGKTMAELPPDVKNWISHRARAVDAVRPILARLLQELV